MNKLRNVLHPIETFRTAPVWVTSTLGCAGIALAGGYLSVSMLMGMEREDLPKDPAVAGACGAIAVYGARWTKSNSRRVGHYLECRDRVENALERHGYSDRLVEPMLSVWCARQATRIACENYSPEAAKQYKILVDTHEDAADLRKVRC